MNILVIIMAMMMMMRMMTTMVVMVMVMVMRDPLPFEEKECTSPPTLLGLLGLLRVVFRNGFLELEMDGVYGSCCLALVFPCFFQNLCFFVTRKLHKWVRLRKLLHIELRVSIKPNEKEVVFRDLKVVNLRIKAIVTEVLRFWHGKDGGFV